MPLVVVVQAQLYVELGQAALEASVVVQPVDVGQVLGTIPETNVAVGVLVAPLVGVGVGVGPVQALTHTGPDGLGVQVQVLGSKHVLLGQ
jgi:hypothetical protein